MKSFFRDFQLEVVCNWQSISITFTLDSLEEILQLGCLRKLGWSVGCHHPETSVPLRMKDFLHVPLCIQEHLEHHWFSVPQLQYSSVSPLSVHRWRFIQGTLRTSREKRCDNKGQWKATNFIGDACMRRNALHGMIFPRGYNSRPISKRGGGKELLGGENIREGLICPGDSSATQKFSGSENCEVL